MLRIAIAGSALSLLVLLAGVAWCALPSPTGAESEPWGVQVTYDLDAHRLLWASCADAAPESEAIVTSGAVLGTPGLPVLRVQVVRAGYSGGLPR